LAPKDFSDTLGPLRSDGLLKDLRHVVQGEPADFLDVVGFNRGIDCLLETGLVYNLLIVARQLEESARFVHRHPNQSFVLDHIAKPDIANGSFLAWETPLRELARREHVVCKLSGIVTEAE
jgi:L-fuconolactonase